MGKLRETSATIPAVAAAGEHAQWPNGRGRAAARLVANRVKSLHSPKAQTAHEIGSERPAAEPGRGWYAKRVK